MRTTALLAIGLASGAALAAPTVVEDFNDYAAGTFVDGKTFDVGAGVSFVVTSSGNNKGANIFDTNTGVNGDKDLQVYSGNALILQDKRGPTPNDSGKGGTLTMTFSEGVYVTSIDLIDMDDHGSSVVTLTDANGAERIFDVPKNFTGDPSRLAVDGIQTLFFDQAVSFGDLGEDATMRLTESGFDLRRVVGISVNLSGSGAIDNLAVAVPMPHPGAMAGACVAGLAVARRRRR
ncbi:MAG: hypothetical protein AAGI53_10955 [Planctomycetota bacterium]